MNNIQIPHKKSFTISFDINISGVTVGEMKAWVVVPMPNTTYEYSFPLKNLNKKWSGDIDGTLFKKDSSYKYILRVIIDDNFFEPFDGTLEITNSIAVDATVSQSDAKNNTSKETTIQEGIITSNLSEIDMLAIERVAPKKPLTKKEKEKRAREILREFKHKQPSNTYSPLDIAGLEQTMIEELSFDIDIPDPTVAEIVSSILKENG